MTQAQHAQRIIDYLDASLDCEDERKFKRFIVQEFRKASNSVPRCGRCTKLMTAQFYQNKITWWSCNPCADAQDSETPITR